MNMVERVKVAAEEACRRGKHPTKVYLTVKDGQKLHFELVTQDRRLGHRIEKEGIHHAVHKLAGLEVVWRSQEFKVS